MATEKDMEKEWEKKIEKKFEKWGEGSCKPKKWHSHGGGVMGGCFYFLAIIGAAVYYVEQVSGFWPTILALLKSLVWPAFLIYEVFVRLAM